MNIFCGGFGNCGGGEDQFEKCYNYDTATDMWTEHGSGLGSKMYR